MRSRDRGLSWVLSFNVLFLHESAWKRPKQEPLKKASLPSARLFRPPSDISRPGSGPIQTGWNVRSRVARGPRPRPADLEAGRIRSSPRLQLPRWERDRAQPWARSDRAPLRFLRGFDSFHPPPRRTFPPPSERSSCRSQEVEKTARIWKNSTPLLAVTTEALSRLPSRYRDKRLLYITHT